METMTQTLGQPADLLMQYPELCRYSNGVEIGEWLEKSVIEHRW